MACIPGMIESIMWIDDYVWRTKRRPGASKPHEIITHLDDDWRPITRNDLDTIAAASGAVGFYPEIKLVDHTIENKGENK